MRKVQLNEEIKSYTKTVNGLSVLNISTYSKNILNFLFDYQYLPLSEEQLKRIGKDKVNRKFSDKMIYTALKINPKTFSKSINELVEAGYLTVSDDLMMLNINGMVKDIHTINTTQIMPILKKGKINELEDLIIEKDKKYFQKLEKMVVAGIADDDEIKEYNELKALLHGSDAISNTTTEIKPLKQPKTVKKETTTIEVEETTKEADLDVEKEIEHKDTSSIIQPLKQPETLTKHEQTEEEMVEEYLKRLIEASRIEELTIKNFVSNYFQTKNNSFLIDLESQMRIYEKGQAERINGFKSYDEELDDFEDDISNWDCEGNLLDGGINL